MYLEERVDLFEERVKHVVEDFKERIEASEQGIVSLKIRCNELERKNQGLKNQIKCIRASNNHNPDQRPYPAPDRHGLPYTLSEEADILGEYNKVVGKAVDTLANKLGRTNFAIKCKINSLLSKEES